MRTRTTFNVAVGGADEGEVTALLRRRRARLARPDRSPVRGQVARTFGTLGPVSYFAGGLDRSGARFGVSSALAAAFHGRDTSAPTVLPNSVEWRGDTLVHPGRAAGRQAHQVSVSDGPVTLIFTISPRRHTGFALREGT